MLLKIMGTEAVSDDDSRKTYTILSEVSGIEFRRQNETGLVKVTFYDENTEFFEVPGNAYVYLDDGKPISNWGSASIPVTDAG